MLSMLPVSMLSLAGTFFSLQSTEVVLIYEFSEFPIDDEADKKEHDEIKPESM